MKKIKFGFANESDPKGSFQGIGLKEGLLILDGEYIGAISCCGDTYVVAKIHECLNHPEYVGKYIARKALYDMYKDGSGVLFLNQKEDYIIVKLESLINRCAEKQEIKSAEDLTKISDSIGPAPVIFKLAEQYDEILSCSIQPSVFEEKNELIKSCQSSFSELNKEIRELQSQRK